MTKATPVATLSLKDKDNKKTFSLTLFYPFDYQDSDKLLSGIFLRWKRPSPSPPPKKDQS
jgi:hypothetical protein